MFAWIATRTGVQLPSPPAFAFSLREKDYGWQASLRLQSRAKKRRLSAGICEGGLSLTRVEPLQDYCWQASILGHATEKAEAARRNLSMRTELNLPSIAAMITAYAKLPPVPDF